MAAGGAASGNDFVRINAEFRRMSTHPADGALGIFHGLVGGGLVNAQNAVVGTGGNDAPAGQILRLRDEL